MFDLNYGAVKLSVERIAGPLGVEVCIIPFPDKVSSDDDIVSALENFFERKDEEFLSQIKLAFFEHVTSPTAIRLPVRRLIDACRCRGVQTMIDGAHALGLFELNLSELDPDYYVYVSVQSERLVSPTVGPMGTNGFATREELPSYTCLKPFKHRCTLWSFRGAPARASQRNSSGREQWTIVRSFQYATQSNSSSV